MKSSYPYRCKARASLPRFLGELGRWILVLLFSACNGLFMDEQKSDTSKNNFDLLWQIFDERYCFFEEKGVDWNQMYDKYLFTVDDPNYLFSKMANMLEELRDGHVTLDDGSGSGSRTYTGWYTPFPENFETSRINTYKKEHIKHLNNGTTFSVMSESVGYLRCPSFSDKFNRNDLNNAMVVFKGLKGVIIDVRNNGGGLVSEAYLLASKFAREKTHVGYVRYKTGKGHNDFSDYFARYVEPDGVNPFHGKVAVLTNRKVYSAANLFVSIMKSLPQACIIGDSTGGGGGVPISAELYNGWTVKLSTNPTFDIEKRSIESGIKPDYSVALEKDSKKDEIIEAAIEWILAK